MNLFGGEPLLRNDIFDIIEYAGKSGLAVIINTNGTLLDISTVSRLKELNVASLHISLDAHSADKLSEIRKGVSFDLLVDNIKRAMATGLNIQLNCTATRVNILGLAGLYRLANKIGVPIFSVGPFHSLGRGRENNDSLVVNSVLYFIWVNLLKAVFVFGKTKFCVKERCDANSYVHIDHLGNCHYCSQMPRGIPFGNILEQGLLEIWHSANYKNIFCPDSIKEPCLSCIFRRIYCNNWRCRAEPAAEKNDIYAGIDDCVRGKISMFIRKILECNEIF